MYQVIKRDGRVADFNITRISHAITKAFDATNIPYSQDVIDMLALQVTADFASKVKDDAIDVESIQDSVEKHCREPATTRSPKHISCTAKIGKSSAT